MTSQQSIDRTLEVYFTDIFKKQEYKLYTLVSHLTKSDQYAKDVIQEVFLKLWAHRSSLHNIDNIEAWLYKLTESRIIDFLKKTASERRLRDALWINLHHFETDTEETVSLKEYNTIIDKAINQLPPQRKLVYRLTKEDGLNYSEIARYLKASKKTIKNYFLRVSGRMRK
ncbi:MAG: sigma-70 family RNA polymerase sigma factor [Bacteroidetes bacterium]|nr:sigma-70 family RNA polymerase sigma factor [Bacteroidota bacterium]